MALLSGTIELKNKGREELIVMAKQDAVNFRIDADVKQEVEAVLYDVGLTMSDAINIFFRKCIAEGGIPFEVKMSPEERAHLRQRCIGSKNRREAQKKSLEKKKEQTE